MDEDPKAMEAGSRGFAEVPHFHGHRDRLRSRFREAGAEALADYELLELILFRAIPRRDVKPLAKALLKRFGSFADVMAAPEARLAEVDGVSAAVATELKLVQAAALRIGRAAIAGRPVLSSWTALIDYCRTAMAFSEREQFRVLYLDRKNALIADEVQQRGTVNHTPVYPREVLKRALTLNATSLIAVHNHPSGDPKPSRADIEMTRELKAAGKALEVELHDHVVIGHGTHASFRSLGLL